MNDYVWSQIVSEGTLNDAIQYIWSCIGGTLSAFLLMMWTLTLRLLLISFYFSLLYFGIAYIKKHMYKKLSPRTNYYCWYLLLCSIILANLWFNNGFISLPSHLLPIFSTSTEFQTYIPYIFIVVSLLSAIWFFTSVYKLVAFTWINSRIRKSMKHMELYDDNENLAKRAALALGLKRKPYVLVADYIYTPVSYGVFKKVILLPMNFMEKYTADELYLLLLHEMTHIKHGDTVKLYLINLVGCFIWQVPVMSIFVKNFKRDSEILCDNRVIGLLNGSREVYENLILKECKYKNAHFGFGFSDSYHAIENRLDALYRYKADGRFKLLTVIPVTMLIFCIIFVALRSEWLTINERYNLEFEIVVLDPETDDYVTLPQEDCKGVYSIEDEKIFVDTVAMITLIQSFAKDGYVSYGILSNNYVVQMGDTARPSGFNTYFNTYVTDILEENQVIIFDTIKSLNQRPFIEYLFLLIASKI